jgi:outer membrane lipoprotein SlyB
MALRIRRGTNAQRLLITPLQGELIYTTDTKQLFVGDGSTVGGTAVDTGSVAFSGITTDVTPDADNLRDIGAAGNRWAEGRFVNIYGALTGNVTGNLTGNVTGNVSGNVTGNVTGNLTGNVSGDVTGDLNGSVFADDSTAMVDGIQKRIKADVYSTAGTLLLSTNPATNVVSNGDVVITDNIVTLLNGLDTLQIGANNSALGTALNIKAPVISNKSLRINSLTDGTSNDSFEINVSRGTLSVPTILQQGDPLFTLNVSGHDGTAYRFSSALFASVETDSNNPVAPGAVPGAMGFATSDDGGASLKFLVFNSFGELGVNVINPTATLSVAGNASFNTTAGVEKVLTGMNSGTYTQVTSSTLETYTALTYAHAIYRAAKVTIHVHWSANDSYIGEFLIANGTGAASIQSIQSTSTGSNPVNAVTADISGANVRLRVQTPNTFSSGTVFKYEVHFTNFVAY